MNHAQWQINFADNNKKQQLLPPDDNESQTGNGSITQRLLKMDEE